MISILMATYNGERFVGEQIESVLRQTVRDFILYICDDNSSDGTWDILTGYAQRDPGRIRLQKNARNSGGAKHNFLQMMLTHRDDYLMLCDQDDVWLPDKIEKTLGKMREMEARYGKDTPLLVHTDLTVVDAQLHVRSPSFKKAMNADYDRTALRQQLIQNTLTGCTALYNRALAGCLTGAPSYMVMHDWWLMLVASAFGKIGHLDEQTILYRQHGGNEIGAKDVRTLGYKVRKLMKWREMKEAISNTYRQAAGLLEVYGGGALTQEQVALLQTYCAIPGMPKMRRWRTVCRLGALKHGFARKVANFIFI